MNQRATRGFALAVFLVLVSVSGLGFGLGATGCIGGGRPHRTLVSSHGGPQVLSLELDVQARPTEVFVDGMRVTRACRKAGRMMRCQVTGLSKRMHRLDVVMDGRPPVRCITDGKQVARCCSGCRKPPSGHR